MDKPIKVFAVAILRHWWESMGCAAFTILGIYFAQSGKSNAWLVSASGVLAIAFFVVAAYRTWEREHQKRCELEAELEAEADMQGSMFITTSSLHPGQRSLPGSKLMFSCEAANHGRKRCQIRRIIFLIWIEGEEPEYKDLTLVDELLKTIDHGEGFRFEGSLPLPSFDLSDLNQRHLSALLMDSLGREYKLRTTVSFVTASAAT